MRRILLLFLLISTQAFSQIKFDDYFDSGNLKSVTTSDSTTYYVTSRADVVGRWFYFRITGVKDKEIKVNFTNSDVNRPVYSYDNKNFERFSASEAPRRNYFQKTFDKDTVFIAYCFPYSYEYLQERLIEWEKSEYVSVDTMGYTLPHYYPMQELVLTDRSVPEDGKLEIWIHARTHPSETPGSYHIDGIIQQLLNNDDVMDYYRKKIVFHLIPFTNPEGVYYGKSRVNFYDQNIEEGWNAPESSTIQEVKVLKKRMEEINSKKVLSVFLNIHSQVSQNCTFWIHTASSTSLDYYKKEFQFANLNTSDNPYFTPADYSQSNLSAVFPEGWLWSNEGAKVMALTYETPYDKYSTGSWVTIDNLYQIGSRTVYAIGEYLQLSCPKYEILDNNNAVLTGTWDADSSSLQFFGNNFYTSSFGSQTDMAAFESESLQPGKYSVYGWWPSSSQSTDRAHYSITANGQETIVEKTQKGNGGQWNLLSEISFNSDSPVTIKVNNASNGKVAADAFRIIYEGQPTDVKENYIPADFVLYQNYPNPFNPSTTIKFKLSSSGKANLSVYNSLGELVTTLVDEKLAAGEHQIIFDANSYNLASGVYYYRLTTANSSITKGMVLVK